MWPQDQRGGDLDSLARSKRQTRNVTHPLGVNGYRTHPLGVSGYRTHPLGVNGYRSQFAACLPVFSHSCPRSVPFSIPPPSVLLPLLPLKLQPNFYPSWPNFPDDILCPVYHFWTDPPHQIHHALKQFHIPSLQSRSS